jgi:putative transposase
MTEYGYDYAAQAKFALFLHIVWVTRYRKGVLTGEISLKAREIIRQVCEKENVKIIKGTISRDYVHLFVSVTPSVSISRVVQLMKGKSSYALFREFDELRQHYRERHLWATGYLCCSSGAVPAEDIREYVEAQLAEEEAGPDRFGEAEGQGARPDEAAGTGPDAGVDGPRGREGDS